MDFAAPEQSSGGFLLGIQMKISASQNDPGYNPRVTPHCEVYLNGEKLYGCVSADSDRGTVECTKRDKDGHIVVLDGEIVMETRRGNVCIFVPEEYQKFL